MARKPTLTTFRASVGRGSRAAKQHEDEIAAVWQVYLNSIYQQSASMLGVVAAAPWTIPPQGEVFQGQSEAMATAARNTDKVRRDMISTTLAGVGKVWGANFDQTNPLIDGLLHGMGEKITNVTRLQRQHIMGMVQRGYDQGQSIVDISRGIRKLGFDVSGRRAAMIARTELAQATNGASYAAARTLEVAEFKQWLATVDSRTRHDHSMVAGQVVKMADKFSVNGYYMEFPGDPSAPAKETIHCRCVLVYTDDPEGMQRVPDHDQIQKAAGDPAVQADDQRWLRQHRRDLESTPSQRAARRTVAQVKRDTPNLKGVNDVSDTAALENLNPRLIDDPAKKLAEVRESLDSVGKVHRWPANERVTPIKLSSGGRGGAYSHSVRGSQIEIGENAVWPRMTVVHEMGHKLDDVPQIGMRSMRKNGVNLIHYDDAAGKWVDTGPAGLELDDAYGGWLKAVRRTQGYKGLAQGTTMGTYHRRATELWARSYFQYVATRSGDKALLAELRSVQASTPRGGPHVPAWSDEEFEKIAPYIEKILKLRGLI